jgi:alkanesulfonate monooxygenase SsuD/methylene tetrahydromethanopterin reductase-like flavin-dependent oxidoreductase (luciferase family)
MRIAAVLSPIVDFDAMLVAARRADELGFDGVGLWDHYHSPKPEWGYIAGWSAIAALAVRTTRVRLVQMVVNNLHFEPGVLAKETSTLAIASGGRFELGIGAGDWPDSFAAWGRPFPRREERISRLEESVAILRRAWTGEAFDFEGRFNNLRAACITPAPQTTPRVVVGVGRSPRLMESAVTYADELNIYADEEVVRRAQAAIARSGRDVTTSMFLSWEWDKWPVDPIAELERWNALGVERFFVSLGADDMPARLDQLGALVAT